LDKAMMQNAAMRKSLVTIAESNMRAVIVGDKMEHSVVVTGFPAPRYKTYGEAMDAFLSAAGVEP
jgi:hypothetical protein